jgi:N-acetylglucosaminyldiphosphoundecaprenol N-acetyl-beta-D-mannosaminyltransferase
MLFVSFGCPKQEKWLARNYREAGVPVAVGVGATIDFLAGAVKRAPVWMRKTGLEWFYRVMQEPKRLAGRYWKDIRVVGPGLVRQFLTMRPRSGVVTVVAGVEREEKELAVLVLPERLDALAARDGGLWAEAEAGVGSTLIADARATVFLDSTGTGRLIRFARMARERGGAFILAGPTVELLRTLDLMKLRGFFTIAADMESAVVLAEKMNHGRA